MVLSPLLARHAYLESGVRELETYPYLFSKTVARLRNMALSEKWHRPLCVKPFIHRVKIKILGESATLSIQ